MVRVLIKISGEYLGGNKKFGFEKIAIQNLTKQITAIHKKDVQLAIILGGGNFFRGSKESIVNRRAGDNIGMLATVMNAICLQSALEEQKKRTRLMTAININQIAEPYIPRRAIRHLEKGRIIILGAGMGIPHFSTDTASVVRAKELDADIVIKGTKVDGIFNKDPHLYPQAKKFSFISYDEIVQKNLIVMDTTAITFSKEQELPIYVLNITTSNGLTNFFKKKYTGTFIDAKENDDIMETIKNKNKK